ncbi:hypothetical protein SLS56_011588 [Neofusicoccum ribis]|uniref:Uncharacterized protein n=1 Tax=Neofusicoccum ribis TaxID=45134 RepID=A0ABR3SCP2_9PEZI
MVLPITSWDDKTVKEKWGSGKGVEFQKFYILICHNDEETKRAVKDQEKVMNLSNTRTMRKRSYIACRDDAIKIEMENLDLYINNGNPDIFLKTISPNMADSWRLGRKRKAGDSSFYDFEDELAQRSSTARNDPGASKHTRYPPSENLKIRKAMRGDKAQQQPRSGSTQAPVKHDTPSLFRKDKTENNVPRIIQESIQIPVNPAKRGTMASTARKPAITYSKRKQPQRKQPGANTHAPARRAAPTSSASQTMEPPSADARRRSHGSGSTDVGVGSSEPAMARSGSSPSRSLRDAPFVSSVFLDERLLERAHHVTVTTTATSTSVSYDLLPVGRSER